MVLLLVALGCPAEQLGIPVPKGGIEAIAMDDLVRDTARLAKGEPGFLAERWADMGLEAREGGRCGVREGTGAESLAIVADEGKPGEASTWAASAVVISVAKAFHGRPADPRAVWFCVGEAPVEAVQTWQIGPVGRGETVITPASPMTAYVAEGASTGELDYRRLEQLARELAVAVETRLRP